MNEAEVRDLNLRCTLAMPGPSLGRLLMDINHRVAASYHLPHTHREISLPEILNIEEALAQLLGRGIMMIFTRTMKMRDFTLVCQSPCPI